jgi:hypothetical protein
MPRALRSIASIALGDGPKGFSLAFNRTGSPGAAGSMLASAADLARRVSSRAAPATAVLRAPAKRRRVMAVVMEASSVRFANHLAFPRRPCRFPVRESSTPLTLGLNWTAHLKNWSDSQPLFPL